MRIIISLLLLLCFKTHAEFNLSVFSKQIELPNSCFLKVDVPKLITINCNDSQFHHITFSTPSEASSSAEDFYLIARNKNEKDIQLVSYQNIKKETYTHFVTHVIAYGKDEYSYIICDDIVCFYIDSPDKEFVNYVLKQLDLSPQWSS